MNCYSHHDYDCYDHYDRHGCHDHHHGHGLGPLVLVSSVPRNRQTGVNPDIRAIKLTFGRSTSKRRRGLINIDNEIDMWRGLKEVPIRIRRCRDNRAMRRIIKVIPVNRLRAGVTYKVRVKSFFIDRHGNRSSTCQIIVFTTGCR